MLRLSLPPRQAVAPMAIADRVGISVVPAAIFIAVNAILPFISNENQLHSLVFSSDFELLVVPQWVQKGSLEIFSS